MTVQNKTDRNRRRNRLSASLAFSLAIGCVSATSGCSSSVGARVASLNPFSNPQAASSPSGESSWFSGPKTAATKSRETVAGWFGGGDKPDAVPEGVDATDPTSLAHKAEVTPEVFVANGRLWESTGNYEKAMESYAKALEKRPNDPDALANIARLHFRQDNHQKAAEYFGKAIKEKPDDAGIYNDLGLTLSKLGNHSAAAATIEQALKLAPGSSRYANNLASVKFEAGDSAGALQVLVKNNKPAVAHFNMAYLHYKHGQAAESSRHLNQALAYAPEAASDPATKRAVERSRELLAQIGNVPGLPAGTAIAKSAATANTGQAVAVGQTPTPGAPQMGVPQTRQGFTPGAPVQGFQGAVQPVSAGKTNVNFGNASYRSQSPAGGVNTPATGQAPTTQTAQPQGTMAPSQKFALPPNFQLPQ